MSFNLISFLKEVKCLQLYRNRRRKGKYFVRKEEKSFKKGISMYDVNNRVKRLSGHSLSNEGRCVISFWSVYIQILSVLQDFCLLGEKKTLVFTTNMGHTL